MIKIYQKVIKGNTGSTIIKKGGIWMKVDIFLLPLFLILSMWVNGLKGPICK
jgi:hypothetical protein